MVSVLTRYLRRSYFKKIERRIDMTAILACWGFNILTAWFVFFLSWLFTKSIFTIAMNTLAAWSATLIISVVYWIHWINKKMRTSEKGKIAAIAAILIMLIACLLIIWFTAEAFLDLAYALDVPG